MELNVPLADDMRRETGGFHFMKGLIELRLGDAESAEESFNRAKRYGRYRDLLIRYGPELRGPTG